MQPLSGLDAAFLYLETDQLPMHVGGVYCFDAIAQNQTLDFHAFRAHIAARLDTTRIWRQRLVEAPLGLDHPYWVDDPRFDLDAHLRQHRLSQPGSRRELLRLAEQFFSEPLARDRPLWDMLFVEGLSGIKGLQPGSFAMLAKVHHAAMDGISGQAMIWSLLQREPSSVQPKPPPWRPVAPSRLGLLARTAGRSVQQILNVARLAGQVATGAFQIVKEKSLQGTPLPPLPLTAPATPFNAPVSVQRTFNACLLPLSGIQAIRRLAQGATVNDVALTICAGALQRYLQGRQALPDQPLVAAVPISIRPPGQVNEPGNRVSIMLVSLATDEGDPVRRLGAIHAGIANSWRYYQTVALERVPEWMPAPLSVLFNRVFSRRLTCSPWLAPLCNLVITNVPGPRQPLYLGGARLAWHLGMAPIYEGLGLILVITSYLDTLAISATSCPAILPDPEAFIGCLETSFAELMTLAQQAEPNNITSR